MTLVLLAITVVLFLHPFVLYPLLLRLLPAPRRPRSQPPVEMPSVAMVICALNEERILGQKLENSLGLDYPKDRLTIYLVNDGSTDGTLAIARTFADRGVRVIDRPARSGKVTNLNELIASLSDDIVLLSDANVIYDPQAVRYLVERFTDPTVGCVSGRVVLTDTTRDIRASEAVYYSIEWFLQQRASEIHSMCGVDGAMHAFRRALFRPFPNDTLIEDFVLGMEITRRGYRVVFEPRAVAWERGPASLREEFKRKVRIAAGAAQSILRRNGFPANAPWAFWFIFVSHKFLRWLSPVVGVAMLILALLAIPHWLAWATLAVAAGFGVLASLRWLTGLSTPLLNAPFYFLFGQLAVAVGLTKGLFGTQSVLWEKANR